MKDSDSPDQRVEQRILQIFANPLSVPFLAAWLLYFRAQRPDLQRRLLVSGSAACSSSPSPILGEWARYLRSLMVAVCAWFIAIGRFMGTSCTFHVSLSGCWLPGGLVGWSSTFSTCICWWHSLRSGFVHFIRIWILFSPNCPSEIANEFDRQIFFSFLPNSKKW